MKILKVKVDGEGIFCVPLDEVSEETLSVLMLFDPEVGEKREVAVEEMAEEDFKNLKDC